MISGFDGQQSCGSRIGWLPMDVYILLNGANWSKKLVTSRSEDCFIKPDIKRQIFVIVFLFKCPSLAHVKQSANRAKRLLLYAPSYCCISVLILLLLLSSRPYRLPWSSQVPHRYMIIRKNAS